MAENVRKPRDIAKTLPDAAIVAAGATGVWYGIVERDPNIILTSGVPLVAGLINLFTRSYTRPGERRSAPENNLSLTAQVIKKIAQDFSQTFQVAEQLGFTTTEKQLFVTLFAQELVTKQIAELSQAQTENVSDEELEVVRQDCTTALEELSRDSSLQQRLLQTTFWGPEELLIVAQQCRMIYQHSSSDIHLEIARAIRERIISSKSQSERTQEEIDAMLSTYETQRQKNERNARFTREHRDEIDALLNDIKILKQQKALLSEEGL